MNNLFLHSENHNSTIFQDVQYNDIQYSNNELTPPTWFTELHANAPQTEQDGFSGRLKHTANFPVPPCDRTG